RGASRRSRARARPPRGPAALRGLRARSARHHRIGLAAHDGVCPRRGDGHGRMPRRRHRLHRHRPGDRGFRRRGTRLRRSPAPHAHVSAGRDHSNLRRLLVPQVGYAHRQAPMGREGMVATCHPLASLAGVETLKSGGNVIDAAVAANAVLGVTQPNYCGFGGDLFCLYYEAETRRVHFLNGAGRSGARATLAELGRRGLAAVPSVGPGSVSVPGVTGAWSMLLERFGTRPLAELLAPAIHYAADGFPISDIVCQAVRERFELFDDPEWRRIFVPGGVFPEPGDMFYQPDLARSIMELGKEPDLFYQGRVGRAHLLLEPTKLAYSDRDRWIADPAHSRPPLEQLLAKSYAGRRRAAFDPEKAQYHAWGDIDGDTTGFVVADGRGNVLSVIQSL